MLWIFTLVSYWIALLVAGLILTAISTAILARISSKFFACLPVLLILVGSYVTLVAITYLAVPQEYWDPTYNPRELELEAFVEEMSPSLARQINKLEAREKDAATKVKKLKQLAANRPNFAERVNVEIAKWEELHASIQKTLADIRSKTEQALVDYKIDEIAGRDKFSEVSRSIGKRSGESSGACPSIAIFGRRNFRLPATKTRTKKNHWKIC